MLTTTSFDAHLEQLFEVLNRLAAAFRQANIDYRVVGGVAIFFHVAARNPLAARATRDIDVAVRRDQLAEIARAVRPFGFEYRHAAGVDMLVDAAKPAARSAVHLVFVSEKVRPEYVEPVPGFTQPAPTGEGVLLAPVDALLRMKLTSYRLKDRVHVQDLDAAGLITPEMEAGLTPVLLARLREIRATE